MSTAFVDKSIDVDCPQHDAYVKLSQVESYAQIPGAPEIQKRGADQAHVVAEIEGQREEFDIALDRLPEEKISWRAVDGPAVESSVTFRRLDDQHTRLELHMEYDPQQFSERFHLSEKDLDQRATERLQVVKSFVEGGVR